MYLFFNERNSVSYDDKLTNTDYTMAHAGKLIIIDISNPKYPQQYINGQWRPVRKSG